MMIRSLLLSFLLLAGVLVFGCAQPAAPSASASVLPSARPSASVAATVEPSVSAVASPSPVATTAHIPSVAPSVLPSSTPKPSVSASIPSLADFAQSFNVATKRAFNDSRAVYSTDPSVWVVDNQLPEFQYTIFIRNSKTRAWSAFDNVETVYGASGEAKNVSLTQGETGPFFKYDVVLKCYDWHYEVAMTLYDYAHMTGTAQYRRTLGPAVLLTLADACPN